MDIDLTTHRAKFLFYHTFTDFDILDYAPCELYDICRVFWASVWTYIVVIGLWFIAIITACMFIPVGIQLLYTAFGIFTPVLKNVMPDLFDHHTILGIMLFIGTIGSFIIYFIIVVFGAIGSCLFTAEKAGDYRQRKIDEGYKPKPSIIAGYYRALKEKTCIKVNYING